MHISLLALYISQLWVKQGATQCYQEISFYFPCNIRPISFLFFFWWLFFDFGFCEVQFTKGKCQAGTWGQTYQKDFHGSTVLECCVPRVQDASKQRDRCFCFSRIYRESSFLLVSIFPFDQQKTMKENILQKSRHKGLYWYLTDFTHFLDGPLSRSNCHGSPRHLFHGPLPGNDQMAPDICPILQVWSLAHDVSVQKGNETDKSSQWYFACHEPKKIVAKTFKT